MRALPPVAMTSLSQATSCPPSSNSRLPARSIAADAAPELQFDLGFIVGDLRLVDERIGADFAGEIGLGQRRSHIGKEFFVAKENNAALMAVLAQKGCDFGSGLPGAHDGDRPGRANLFFIRHGGSFLLATSVGGT